MLRRACLVVAFFSLPACITLRGAAGPVMTPDGHAGVEAAIAMGAGNGLGDHRGWFVSSKFGFSLEPIDKEPGLVLQACADYVSEKGAAERDHGLAWRAGARLGGRPVFVSEEETVGYMSVGAAVAVFPLSWAPRSYSGGGNEKMGDLFDFGDQRTYYNLGLELAAERLFSPEADDHWLLSLALVFDMSSL